MKNMKRILSAAAVFVLAGSMLAGCGSSSGDDNTLVMATNATFRPTSMWRATRLSASIRRSLQPSQMSWVWSSRLRMWI